MQGKNQQQFLLEMGTVLLQNSKGMSLGSDGVVIGPGGKWTPRADLPDLSELLAALRMVGLDPTSFKFQVYEVAAANTKFPAQLVIKGDHYAGQHQLDLLLQSPFVAATEIKSYSTT